MSDEPVYGPPRSASVWEKIPAGPIQSVVWRVFGLGLQASKKGNPSWKIIVYFEINYRRKEGEYKGKRALVNQAYNIGFGDKSYMRRDYERILQRAFTPQELADPTKINLRMIEGRNCVINIVHKTADDGKVYNNVDAVLPLMEGMAPMTAETDPKFIPPYVTILLKNRVPPTEEGAARNNQSAGNTHPTAEREPGAGDGDFADDIPY